MSREAESTSGEYRPRRNWDASPVDFWYDAPGPTPLPHLRTRWAIYQHRQGERAPVML